MRFPKKTLELYRSLADEFRLATGKETYRLGEVIAWALNRGQLTLDPEDVRRLHENILREAMRSDTIEDEQGRRVRVRHCVEVDTTDEDGKEVQETLWAHVDEAPTPFLIESLRQRRNRIVEDVRHLQADLDHINAILEGRGKRSIQMSFDFTSETGDSTGAA